MEDSFFVFGMFLTYVVVFFMALLVEWFVDSALDIKRSPRNLARSFIRASFDSSMSMLVGVLFLHPKADQRIEFSRSYLG